MLSGREGGIQGHDEHVPDFIPQLLHFLSNFSTGLLDFLLACEEKQDVTLLLEHVDLEDGTDRGDQVV